MKLVLPKTATSLLEIFTNLQVFTNISGTVCIKDKRYVNITSLRFFFLFLLFLCFPNPSVFASSPSLSLSQGQQTNTGKHMYCELLQNLAVMLSMLDIPRWYSLKFKDEHLTLQSFSHFYYFVQGEREKERSCAVIEEGNTKQREGQFLGRSCENLTT